MSIPNPQPSNPTEILAAQLKLQENAYRLAQQTHNDVNQKLDAIAKEQASQSRQFEELNKTVFAKSFPVSLKFIAISAVLAMIVAGLWVGDYLFNTIIDPGKYNNKIVLWKYVTGEEYNLGLSATDLIFVVVTRFIIGFSLTLGATTFLLLVIDSLIKLVKGLFKK